MNNNTETKFQTIHSHYSSTIYGECKCGMYVVITGRKDEDSRIVREHERVFHK